MALDPRIIMSARLPNVDVQKSFNNALLNIQAREGLQQQRTQAPFQNQLLEAQAQQAETEADRGIREAKFESIVFGAQEILPTLTVGDTAGTMRILENRRADLVAKQLPTDETDRAIQTLQTDPQALIAQAQEVVERGTSMGILNRPDLGPAGTREFESQITGLSPEDIALARRIDLGLSPRATGSAAQTIAATGVAPQVAASQAEIAGAVSGASEDATLRQQLKWKPAIAKAVKTASDLAAEKGEILSDLNRMNAALPGLRSAVDALRELAPIVTSTFGGKVFNAAAKELGFGATKGGTARARYISIIANQVLPLLKPTFGGSFTVTEGDELKATLGDPDQTPEAKIAALDAFMDQKIRDIESKERQKGLVGLEGPADKLTEAQLQQIIEGS